MYSEVEKTEYSELSDAELVIFSRKGDVYAEDALISRYRQKVKSISRSYYLLGGDKEDLIQEGMIGLMYAIRSFSDNGPASFNTYATSCVVNKLKSAVRSDLRLKNVPLNSGVSLDELQSYENSDNSFFSSNTDVANPEETILAREISEETIALYFSYLSNYEKSVLKLYLAGFSSSEIAEKLFRTAKSVENAVQRIKIKLSQQINSGDFSKS